MRNEKKKMSSRKKHSFHGEQMMMTITHHHQTQIYVFTLHRTLWLFFCKSYWFFFTSSSLSIRLKTLFRIKLMIIIQHWLIEFFLRYRFLFFILNEWSNPRSFKNQEKKYLFTKNHSILSNRNIKEKGSFGSESFRQINPKVRTK